MHPVKGKSLTHLMSAIKINRREKNEMLDKPVVDGWNSLERKPLIDLNNAIKINKRVKMRQAIKNLRCSRKHASSSSSESVTTSSLSGSASSLSLSLESRNFKRQRKLTNFRSCEICMENEGSTSDFNDDNEQKRRISAIGRKKTRKDKSKMNSNESKSFASDDLFVAHDAAIKIQAFVRGFFHRLDYRLLLLQKKLLDIDGSRNGALSYINSFREKLKSSISTSEYLNVLEYEGDENDDDRDSKEYCKQALQELLNEDLNGVDGVESVRRELFNVALGEPDTNGDVGGLEEKEDERKIQILKCNNEKLTKRIQGLEENCTMLMRENETQRIKLKKSCESNCKDHAASGYFVGRQNMLNRVKEIMTAKILKQEQNITILIKSIENAEQASIREVKMKRIYADSLSKVSNLLWESNDSWWLAPEVDKKRQLLESKGARILCERKEGQVIASQKNQPTALSSEEVLIHNLKQPVAASQKEQPEEPIQESVVSCLKEIAEAGQKEEFIAGSQKDLVGPPFDWNEFRKQYREESKISGGLVKTSGARELISSKVKTCGKTDHVGPAFDWKKFKRKQ